MPTAPPSHKPPGYTPRKPWTRANNVQPKPLGRPWRALRLRVFRRDGYRCQACGRLCAHPECDHIVSRADGGTDELANLQTMCADCHKAKTHKESQRAASCGTPPDRAGG